MNTRSALVKAMLCAPFIAALVAFMVLDGSRYLSLEALKNNRDALVAFADTHRATAPLIAFAACAGAVALSLPGGLVFSLAIPRTIWRASNARARNRDSYGSPSEAPWADSVAAITLRAR